MASTAAGASPGAAVALAEGLAVGHGGLDGAAQAVQGVRQVGAFREVRAAIMPQPISTPTAAGMIAPTVGITLPMVEPLPRCTSGITARWRKMKGRRAVFISCWPAASSTGTPRVHSLIGHPAL
jgi:hypothetical protein